MKRITAWFAKNTVAANLLMLVIVFSGLITMNRVVMEVFPELEIDIINITVSYPGSTPEEVEKSVCIRIEEAIWDLNGIDRITSLSREGSGTVTVEVEPGYELRELQDEITSRVDALTTLPDEAEKPVVARRAWKRMVVYLTLSGHTDDRTLKYLSEKIRDELVALPQISSVETGGIPDFEISVEVSEDALRRHGFSLGDIRDAISRSSLDLPGGAIKSKDGDILLRTVGQSYTGRDFEEVPIYSQTDGTMLTLGDIAFIKDGFVETDRLMRFDGKKAAQIEIYRVGDQNVLEVAQAVKDYVDKIRPQLPEGISIDVWRDRSDHFRGRLDLLSSNGLTGFILVVVLLSLFLRAKVAFWVSLGIPISFLGAVWLMPPLNVSLNMITMFAFILVLGIVVDDAIVVGESIYSRQEKTGQGLMASIKGCQDVAVPVVFAVLTTVAAFVPMLNVPGTWGQVYRMIPLIVIPCLLFSLVESLLILPAHLSHYKPQRRSRKGPWSYVQGFVSKGLVLFTRKVYRPGLEICLRWRYLTLAVFIAVLLASASLLPGGRLKFTFFPHIESNSVICYLDMAPGTAAKTTHDAILHIEKTARELNRFYKDKLPAGAPDMVTHILARADEDSGRVYLELASGDYRKSSELGANRVAARWLKMIGAIPDAVSLTMRSSMGRRNRPIHIQLSGPNIEELARAAEELKLQIASYPGIREVEDSFRRGKREVKLKLKPAASTLGISLSDLARQVRQGFYGTEAQRVVRGRDEMKVMVRYPEHERSSLGNLEEMRVRTPGGEEVPITSVAELYPGRGFASIDRADRRRVVEVSAKTVPGQANASEIVSDIMANVIPELMPSYPDISFRLEGQAKEQQESTDKLLADFGLAMFLIFALMAIPLRSYVQPIIVMAAIPFSAVGAIWGHIILGLNLSMLSALGFVALAGVVVNDSLVLVHYTNRLLCRGSSLAQAVRVAGEVRLRPILLTSLTTFAGLMPLIMEDSIQAKFLVPMGVSLGFGVMFATFITLVLVPASYLIMDDVRSLFRRFGHWWQGKEYHPVPSENQGCD